MNGREFVFPSWQPLPLSLSKFFPPKTTGAFFEGALVINSGSVPSNWTKVSSITETIAVQYVTAPFAFGVVPPGNGEIFQVVWGPLSPEVAKSFPPGTIGCFNPEGSILYIWDGTATPSPLIKTTTPPPATTPTATSHVEK